MSKGLVYILTNPCLDGWVKIGMTEKNDIEKRIQGLNASNLPLSYRCYATYETEKPDIVEKSIHNLIDKIDFSLRAREPRKNGGFKEREFFKISPETAYGIFKEVAILREESDNLKFYMPTIEESEEQEIAESRTKRSNNSFNLLGIEIGEEISFLYDDTIVAKVFNNKNKAEFENAVYSVTGLAKKILIEKYNWQDNLHVNGWRFFTKDGVTLSDLRDQIESEQEEEE